jgi:hypothetical protein
MNSKSLVRRILDALSDLGVGRLVTKQKKIPLIKLLVNSFSKSILRRYLSSFANGNPRRAEIFFSDTPIVFGGLAKKYGSDKEEGENESFHPWQNHTYGSIYELLFAHCRTSFFNVFECGIGTINAGVKSNMGIHGNPGGSLRIWRDYFPNAHIVGADIDPSVLFYEDRIQTFLLDQTCTVSIAELWMKFPNTKFDLMVDDGLHLPEAGITLLKNSIQMLQDDGVYIIEDVSFRHFKSYKLELQKQSLDYALISCNRASEDSLDNNLLVIRKNKF